LEWLVRCLRGSPTACSDGPNRIVVPVTRAAKLLAWGTAQLRNAARPALRPEAGLGRWSGGPPEDQTGCPRCQQSLGGAENFGLLYHPENPLADPLFARPVPWNGRTVFCTPLSVSWSMLGSMNRDCGECQRLWRAYNAATTVHLALENRLQLAALGRENEAFVQLTLDIEDVAQKRASASETIRQHETVSGHGEAATSASAE
jgi:hypothetical protein